MKPQCNSTCQSECGCLCDRTPGAAVPADWRDRVHPLVLDGTTRDMTFNNIEWYPPHDGRVAQIQCDRGPLDAWHDAQEQEAKDAAWRDARARTVLRVAAGALTLVGMFAIYWGTK